MHHLWSLNDEKINKNKIFSDSDPDSEARHGDCMVIA